METRVAFTIDHGIPIPPAVSRSSGPRGDCKCGGFPRPGYKACDRCLESTKKQRTERLKQGLCEYFGCLDPPKEGHTSCQTHLKKMLAYSLELRAKRIRAKACIDCGKRPQWWTLRCVMCRANISSGLPAGALRALRQYRRFEAINERREKAEEAVALLSNERERRIFTLRHGLSDGVDRTLEEIGVELEITRERVRQIEARALRNLELIGIEVKLLRPPFVETQRPKTGRHIDEYERKKQSAHTLVAQAIRDGKIKKQPCKVCGNERAIAHHPDYDKPLEVEWLCLSHHMAAHGRGKGSKRLDKHPVPIGPRNGWWLNKAKPNNSLYDAASIVVILRTHRIKQKEFCTATGLHSSVANLIVNGRSVKDSHLLAVLRYVDELRLVAPSL